MAITNREFDKRVLGVRGELDAYLRWYLKEKESPTFADLTGKLAYFLREAYKKGYIDGRKEEREENA